MMTFEQILTQHNFCFFYLLVQLNKKVGMPVYGALQLSY